MIDLHVHTCHSCDSTVNMDTYCQKALQTGVQCICFTDHVDMNPADRGYGYYNAEEFFKEFHAVREKYQEQLIVLSGIEFSEPHVYRKEFDDYRSLPYDFILGSIHFWAGNMFPSQMVKTNFPAETAFELYWEEVYQAVSYGGFDSLAHLDFPKRYYKQCIWTKTQMNEIFSEMIKRNIALEINTSSLRKGLAECMPDKDFLEVYESVGGVNVTIGADTHAVHELATGYDYAKSLVTGKLQSVVFMNRKAGCEDELKIS